MKSESVSNSGLPKTLWGFYAKYACRGLWGLVAAMILFRFIYSFDAVLWPMYQRWFIGALETAPAGVNLFEYCMPTILLILFLLLITDSSNLLRNWALDKFRPRAVKKMTTILTDYVHSQSMFFWTQKMAGQIYSRMNDIGDGMDVLIWDVTNIFLRSFMILINSVALFSVNRYIAIIFIVVFIFRATFVWYLRNPIKRTSKASADAKAKMTGKLVDGFSNATSVKLFAGATREHEYMKPIIQDWVDKKLESSLIQRIARAVPDFVWDVSFGVAMVLFVWMYGTEGMSLADVVYAITVYTMVVSMIGGIMDSIPPVIDRLSAASKAYADLVVPITIVDKPDATELVVKHGKIEFKNISFKYKNKYVLKDFSLTVKPGERIGLVGTSGAGKTTLVNLLMRFYDVNRGAILIDGQDIRDVTQQSLRENIAFIPQETTMFNRTIRENIAYGNPNATEAQIHNAAKRSSAHDFIMATDKKYDSFVGDRGIKLSGGQRQRVAIARAFLKQSPILVLDEATSALDSETELVIQKSFGDLSKNRTTIAIAHRLSTLRNMDKIVVLEKGKIIESGTHNALLRKKNGLYARLWKMQSGGFLQE